MSFIKQVGGAVAPTLSGMGGAAADAAKSVGGAIGELNPFKKGPTYKPGSIDDPNRVTAPVAPTGGPSIVGAPTSIGGPKEVGKVDPHKGAQIGVVADPREILMDPSMQAQFRAQQQENISRLAAQAQGQGPSLAGEMLTQNQRSNQAATYAQMASQRGGANPMAARSAMMAASQSQGQLGRDAAAARIQEQMSAQQQLAGALTDARQQDIGMALEQAKLSQERELATYRGQLERAIQQGQLDQQTANAMFEQANTNARLSFEQQSISAREAYGQQNQNARQNATMAQQFQQLQAEYARMGMSAQQANQAAAMQVQQMRNAERQKAFESEAAASAAQRQAIGGLLSGAAQIGMTYATGGLGGPAIMAAGGLLGGPAGGVQESPTAVGGVSPQGYPLSPGTHPSSPGAYAPPGAAQPNAISQPSYLAPWQTPPK